MSEAIFTTRQAEPPKTPQQYSGGPTANRPANAELWLHYFDTDLGYTVVWDGSRWRTGAVGPTGATGAQGAAGTNGGMAPDSAQPPANRYSLTALGGNSASIPVTLSAGTWQLSVTHYVHRNDGGNFEIQCVQYADLVGVASTYPPSTHLKRTGGSGFGRDVYAVGVNVASGTVSSQRTTTLNINTATWINGTGTVISCTAVCQKIS
jgi:hypothetical protein